MSRHDIRLRRKIMTSRRIEGYKDYQGLMQKHKRTGILRRTIKFILFLAGLLLVVYLLFILT
ncbi:MAG: hypothetical protein OEX02_09420 [Cyclobacteriaceae bacterium]|nr:hypothetical protein [Cyclobacteriaceae bacterium]